MKAFLIYSEKNKAFANDFVADMARVGLEFIRDERHLESREQDNALLDRETQMPIVLLLSDNFLHSKECMYQAFRFVENSRLRSRLHTLVIEGVAPNGQSVPTHFERVSNVIQYMNYWQDMYLEMRRERAADHNNAAFERELQMIRSISSEVGEFLRLLKEAPYQYFDQAYAHKFREFFSSLQLTHLATNYLALPEYDYKKQGNHHAVSHVVETIVQEKPTPTPVAEVEIPEEVVAPEPQVAPVQENPQTIVEQLAEQKRKEQAEKENEAREALVESPVLSHVMNSVEEMANDDAKISNMKSSIFPERNVTKDKSSFELLQSLFEDEAQEENLVKKVAQEVAETNTNELLHDTPKIVEENQDMKKDEVTILSENEQSEEETVEAIAERLVNKYEEPPTLTDQDVLVEEAKAPHSKESLETILEDEDNQPQALVLLGEQAEKEGNFLLAKTYYEKAESLNEDYPGLAFRLATLLNHEFKGQNKAAAKYYKKSIRENPNDEEALYNYGVILYEHLGENKKALELFDRVLELAPRHPFANYDKAVIHYEKGSLKKAAAAYLAAVELNPELKTEQNDRAFQVDRYLAKMQEAAEKAEAERIALATAEAERLAAEKAAAIPPKVVLITGATSGIGLATAREFAKQGESLILTGRRGGRLESLKQELENEFGVQVSTLVFDVRDAKSCAEQFESLPEALKNVDFLINNAGLASGFDPIHEGNLSDWETMIDTNIKGLLYMTRLVVPGMVARKKGHIVNISSIAAKQMYPNGNVYSATKAAVDALTKSMRLDLLPHHIRVSSVSPGHVEETEFALVRHHGDADKANIYKKFRPLTAADVAEAIHFIVSRPAHVTINDLDLSGTQQATTTMVDKSGRE
jgi:NADP-dependent 3-hydroxy acid dehydrogenase YdfG/Tfp pilus assembly protein PilF